MDSTRIRMQSFAQTLIAHELKVNKPSKGSYSAGFQVCDKLRPELAILMGRAGFRSLLSRSLALANLEVQWLRAVHIKTDGSFEGLEDLQKKLSPPEYLEGGLTLLSHVLGLLVAFIGEVLTVQLVRDIWPGISFQELDLSDGDTNEK